MLNRTLGLVASLCVGLAACAPTPRGYYRDPDNQPADLAIKDTDVRQRIALVGDAGSFDGAKELIRLLAVFLAPLGDRTQVVYLGDNVSTRGSAIVDERGTSKILKLQLRMPRAGVLFVPGDGDWDDGGLRAVDPEVGVEKVANEARYVSENSGELLPPAGCPGPAAKPLDGAKLVALDSQWWLLDPKRRAEVSRARGCDPGDEEEILAALAAELACPEAGPCPPRIVVAHHPLASYGEHGGHFAWHEHLLCARYIPLPIFCSGYVLARQHGVWRQDLSSSRYRHFTASIGRVLAENPPLLYAAGHDHNLQVLESNTAAAEVVSGAGSKTDHAGHGPRALFSLKDGGFFIVDVLNDGRVALRGYGVGGREEIRNPVYAGFLEAHSR